MKQQVRGYEKWKQVLMISFFENKISWYVKQLSAGKDVIVDKRERDKYTAHIGNSVFVENQYHVKAILAPLFYVILIKLIKGYGILY